MINNFKQFVKLNEGYIGSSGSFIYKLKQVYKQEGDSRVGQFARHIYNLIKDRDYIDDDDIKQNFFNITDKPDMLSFIQHSKLPETWDEDDTDEELVPYELKRNEMKIGRILKYLCDFIHIPRITDKELEYFVNAYKSTTENKIEFKLVKGDDIALYYDEDKYFNGHGSLGGSCMGDASKKMLKIYSKNSNKVQLLIYVDENDKVHGRALLWKLNTSPCAAKYFMDRAYTNSAVDEIRFKQYAEKNGFLYKKYMNSHVNTNVNFIYKGKEVNGVINVKLDGDCKKYPFLDTMPFLNTEKTELSNISDINSYILHDTDGRCKVCYGCDGSLITKRNWIIKDNLLCRECSSSHITLKDCGIETSINTNIKADSSGDFIYLPR